jgi:hypothetical protein
MPNASLCKRCHVQLATFGNLLIVTAIARFTTGIIQLLYSTYLRASGLLLRQTRDNLDLLRIKLILIVHFEVHVLDDESPHFIAESVGIEVALHTTSSDQFTCSIIVAAWVELHFRTAADSP